MTWEPIQFIKIKSDSFPVLVFSFLRRNHSMLKTESMVKVEISKRDNFCNILQLCLLG